MHLTTPPIQLWLLRGPCEWRGRVGLDPQNDLEQNTTSTGVVEGDKHDLRAWHAHEVDS